MATCRSLQAGLVKAPAPELAAPPSLVERHADRMKKSGFIIPQEVRRAGHAALPGSMHCCCLGHLGCTSHLERVAVFLEQAESVLHRAPSSKDPTAPP